MTQKEKLYYLIENYNDEKYDTRSFCNQFVEIFSEGVEDYSGEDEKNFIVNICMLAERYSPFKEDLEITDFFIDEITFRELFDQLYKQRP